MATTLTVGGRETWGPSQGGLPFAGPHGPAVTVYVRLTFERGKCGSLGRGLFDSKRRFRSWLAPDSDGRGTPFSAAARAPGRERGEHHMSAALGLFLRSVGSGGI